MCIWPCAYGDCVCVCVIMHMFVHMRVCLYGRCVVFVWVSGHVCLVTVGVCMGVCMFVNVCVCVVVVLCLYVSLAMFVW